MSAAEKDVLKDILAMEQQAADLELEAQAEARRLVQEARSGMEQEMRDTLTRMVVLQSQQYTDAKEALALRRDAALADHQSELNRQPEYPDALASLAWKFLSGEADGSA